jgi:hypothetical protein
MPAAIWLAPPADHAGLSKTITFETNALVSPMYVNPAVMAKRGEVLLDVTSYVRLFQQNRWTVITRSSCLNGRKRAIRGSSPRNDPTWVSPGAHTSSNPGSQCLAARELMTSAGSLLPIRLLAVGIAECYKSNQCAGPQYLN